MIETHDGESGIADFFVSYSREDRAWAEWIAWELEDAGYRVLIEAWDFRPGSNFMHEIEHSLERADRTIAVLSPVYLQSRHAKDELYAAMLYGRESSQRLLPVRVQQCDLTRFLGAYIYIDLVGIAEGEARSALLGGVARGRNKPASPPRYPGTANSPAFPGGPAAVSTRTRPVLAGRAGKAVLAILPFSLARDITPDSQLLEGFCDDLVGQLTRLQALLVISPSSISHYLRESSDPGEIGRMVGADLVLVGKLHLQGERRSLHFQLVDCSSNITTWADSFSLDSKQLLRLKNRIAKGLTGALNLGRSSGDRQRLEADSTRMERAYELYVRGQGLLSANEEQQVQTATDLLNEALGIDPSFSKALAARGYAEWRKYFSGWHEDISVLEQAVQDVNAALGIDPDCVSAHMTLIRICWDMGWHERALELGKSIYTAHPTSLEATLAFARALNNAGLADEALPLTLSVLQVDRTNPTALKLAIWNHLMVGDSKSALSVAERYFGLHPRDSNTRWAVALAHCCVGQTERAITVAESALGFDSGDVTLWTLLGYLHRVAGDKESAVSVWTRGIEEMAGHTASQRNWRVQAWLANMEACVGREDQARSRVCVIRANEPKNGYVTYRLSHVLAELGEYGGAVSILGESIMNGFLSIQLMRHEEKFGYSRLTGLSEYWTEARKLELAVERMRGKYCLNGIM